MIYPFELTVPFNTPETALVSVRNWIAPGKIVRMQWVMPNGCNDMVWARLFINETQLVPIQPDTWLKGNGVMGPFEFDITVPSGGAHLELRACSPDTTYKHVITLYVDLVEEGAQLEDVIAAVNRAMLMPVVTDKDIQAEGESHNSNVFLEEKS